MLKLDQAVIVEGKYDKIRLSNLIDGLIIPTGGFRFFRDPSKQAYIRELARTVGLIVLTDSDHAGQLIRHKVTELAKGGVVIQVYLPNMAGKERRKRAPGAEGLLGVEGTPDQVILQALADAGVREGHIIPDHLTKADLMGYGLSGTAGSHAFRQAVQKELMLPAALSANDLLSYINRTGQKEALERACERCRCKTKN